MTPNPLSLALKFEIAQRLVEQLDWPELGRVLNDFDPKSLAENDIERWLILYEEWEKVRRPCVRSNAVL